MCACVSVRVWQQCLCASARLGERKRVCTRMFVVDASLSTSTSVFVCVGGLVCIWVSGRICAPVFLSGRRAGLYGLWLCVRVRGRARVHALMFYGQQITNGHVYKAVI